jgi:DNA-binding transcriptional MerR regulator
VTAVTVGGVETREGTIGIRELSERTALSMDTLRWYEREGLLPLVDRTATGQRRYGPAAVRFVLLVQALRRTGMPVAEVREFVQLGGGVLANHPTRMEMLERQRAVVAERMAELRHDQALIEQKIEQYRRLIALGLDCEDEIAEAAAG